MLSIVGWFGSFVLPQLNAGGVGVPQRSRLRPQEAWLANGTPGEMPSPASTSSLFNRLQLDDDLEDGRDPFAIADTRDLFVTVDDPKKHVSTMETYITYRVSTKVRLSLISVREKFTFPAEEQGFRDDPNGSRATFSPRIID